MDKIALISVSNSPILGVAKIVKNYVCPCTVWQKELIPSVLVSNDLIAVAALVGVSVIGVISIDSLRIFLRRLDNVIVVAQLVWV